MEVEHLKKEQITAAAELVLTEFATDFDWERALPVPVEDILECYLDVTLEFGNLQEMLGGIDILAASWIQEKRVVVDDSLDPAEVKHNEGRYRFTVAHEIGHWVLHTPFLQEQRLLPTSFDGTGASVICRSNDYREPREWQADYFASNLLLPEKLVMQEWERIFGNTTPQDITVELGKKQEHWGSPHSGYAHCCDIARLLAKPFGASATATQYRLWQLGLLQVHDTPETLPSTQIDNF